MQAEPARSGSALVTPTLSLIATRSFQDRLASSHSQ